MLIGQASKMGFTARNSRANAPTAFTGTRQQSSYNGGEGTRLSSTLNDSTIGMDRAALKDLIQKKLDK